MAASLNDIKGLVWMNNNTITKLNPHSDGLKYSPPDATQAAMAPRRINRTR